MQFALGMPENLKRLTIFEDFNEDIGKAYLQDRSLHSDLVRRPEYAVAATLCGASLNLEHLAASFIIRAEDFMLTFQYHWYWKDLVSLTLTSGTLDEQKPAEMTNLLSWIGLIARNMPKLRTMELWNGRRGLACVFRYEVTDFSATISWYGTWAIYLHPVVIRIWTVTAYYYNRHTLQMFLGLIPRHDAKSHGDAIRLLKLKEQIVHPVSLQQIRMEANHPFPAQP
jgi:hypothetical protein